MPPRESGYKANGTGNPRLLATGGRIHPPFRPTARRTDRSVPEEAQSAAGPDSSGRLADE